jgi:hypothetical protein
VVTTDLAPRVATRAGETDEIDEIDRDGERGRVVGPWIPLASWTAVVVLGGVLVYVVLVATGEKRLDGVPLHAAFDPLVHGSTLVPIVVLVATVRALPRLRTVRWAAFLGVWWGIAVAWALALASMRGAHRIVAPFERAGDYAAALPQVSSVGAFLATFVDRISTFPTHVQGHPPGFVLVVRALHDVGLGGSAPLALVVIVVGGAAVPFALIAVREVVSEEWARRAAPFLAIGPFAIWIATSADAFFAGIGAAAVTTLVVATGRRGGGRLGLAVAGGLLFGACALLSYGLVLLGLVPLVVAVARRALVVIGIATLVAVTALLVVFATTGFWWFDGLVATSDRYFAGIASRRPYELFVVANVSMLAIALGPAVAVALARLRDRSCWLLVGGALLALAVADVTGMSKSEVERIWLPFMPFVVVSAGALGRRPTRAAALPVHSLRGPAGWLVLQGSTAVVVESLVRTAW